ncbi:MAG: pantoate--beta-alanine ligase [Planctomycetota bacterium]|jgi:pantoate--beta-alanine ligase
MRTCRLVPELRAALAGAPRPVGFVPTMGALHDGHASLVAAARAACATVVASVFVNPLQFDDPGDLAKYPRDPERDAAILRDLGCDLLFAPTSFYPEGFQTHVLPGAAAAGYEGALRGDHFRGVCTVVTKLFSAVRPDHAFFGEKDAQQLAVIRRLSADLDLGVDVVACPTVRAPDGLALSSRNARLSAADREVAVGLSAGLFAARAAWHRGERSFEKMIGAARAPGLEYDYLDCVDPGTFQAPGPLMIAAVRVGGVRLIDNLRLDHTA